MMQLGVCRPTAYGKGSSGDYAWSRDGGSDERDASWSEAVGGDGGVGVGGVVIVAVA